jgi:hypothetical protein
MSQLNLKNTLKRLVVTFLLLFMGQSINAATLRWEDNVVDWDDGVILGVDDLFIPQNGKTYDVTFIDGRDPLSIYGIDSSFNGELYEGARWLTGHQIGALASFFRELSTINIDPRLINGIDDKSNFSTGVIHILYLYNANNLMTSY